MKEFRFIEFQQMRDFSEKVSTTLSFVTQNFKSLFRSILYIAGPPLLIVSILGGTFMSDFFKLSLQSRGGDPDAALAYFTSVNLWLQIIAMLIFFLVSMVMTTATVNNYLILYREKKTNVIEVSDVWVRVRETFWMYMRTSLLFGVFFVLAFFVLTIPTFVLTAISPFLVIFGVIFLMSAIFYLYISTSLIYVIQAFEEKGFFSSVERSFYLTRGKWWSTFGTYFILAMLVGIISYVFFIPGYIIMVVSALHSVKENSFEGPGGFSGTMVIVLMTLYYLCQMVLTCLPNIGLAFQYFNLVEMKEAKGLMNQIDTLGQAPGAPTQEEHY
ncbi:hypothetical protein BH10BAC4_BH10BAC4_07410 [soil metagenome]